MTSAISEVDFHCEKNNEAHKTNEISTERLIVRRGERFRLTIHSSNDQSLNANNLELTVQTGPEPSEDLGTKSVFGVTGKSQSKKPWVAKVKDTSPTSVTLYIISHDFASIGEYSLSVKTHPDMTEGDSVGTFVLLFNPWCKKDWVYLDNEKEREEYVINEQGLLYQGTCDYIGDMPWDFGQFEEDILDICLKILDLNPKCLDNAAEDFSARCNPIYVGRVVSAMINCNDDSGVLQGNWSGCYFSGMSPLHWNGSVDILRTWKESEYRPVKYGQCWVFGGVMCTVLRCLGIPCRPVTNFESAHDTHGNLIIDDYYSDHGVEPKECEDSIWNYHVWVEAWMRRPDLPGEPFYDGWQVLDPTPQELSDGVHCCGPAPVKAVHEGHTDLKYDLPFVFAEVNADRVTWQLKADGSQKKMHSETKAVGWNISTKAVGSDEREDITGHYKHAEGSKKERKAFKEAVRRTEKRRKLESDEPPPEISVKIEEKSKPMNGKDIDLVIRLQSPTPQNLLVHANAQVMLYNGMLESNIWSEEIPVKLLANKELKVPFQIPFSKYGSHIQGTNSIKVSAVVNDKENTEEVYMAERNIVPENPPISISVTGKHMQFKSMQATITFDNPLDVALNDCSITLTASGLFKHSTEAKLESLDPGARLVVLVPFTPYKSGRKRLVADFDCDRFRDIKARCTVDVERFAIV
ncbi:hypothetical protein COCON_G00182410 [Conger conger]|uniref:Protein-glutamine gamma-glutamyltransferase 2 n=1 Tax=Conger conger TaxID=82655 RepID=A0A9Q1HT84_CONCO|nr:protein-glutamine gamma-glutamyltransferase 2-like [Conger conger]KAJ8259229.1 hypothetical protein COCON_G00182410 [Conger conger]